ncbi:hypothetical protein Syun_012681 [Stephania yunnanensis]|uniref:Pectinesterase inhibitor domain-containing protein n=1 Tax=Stephania yunnanensis TaxID=152371 RepID=A0AAP0K023_9MAGN
MPRHHLPLPLLPVPLHLRQHHPAEPQAARPDRTLRQPLPRQIRLLLHLPHAPLQPPMRPRESQALKDCVDTMGDGVDRLAKSINELSRLGGRVGGQSFLWHMSNVQTWVSAALTDDSTCVDGFAGHALDGRVKAQIRSRVLNVAQVTSNALALVNRFAAKSDV